MQSIHPQESRRVGSGARWQVLSSIAKHVAAIFILAASAAGAVHYLNISLDAMLPDSFHPSVGAATPATPSSAPVARPAPAPKNFSSQFPPPSGPVEPQPETF